MNQCERGYTGPLCGLCQNGFAKIEYLCVECSSKIVNITALLFTVLLYLLALLFFVRFENQYKLY